MNYDAIKQSFASLVRALTSKYDYHAMRAARVIAQNDDTTLELVPEDDAWPGMSHVPIRIGVPGVTVKVRAGARVLFTFEGGDSTQPVAVLWDSAAVEKLEVKAAAVDLRPGASRAIALNGDMVMIPSQKPVPVFLFTDPAGLVPAVTLAPGAPLPPMFARFGLPPSFTMVGQIVAVSPNRS